MQGVERPWSLLLVGAAAAVLTGVAAAATDGNFGATLAPILVPVALWAVFRFPLRYTLGALFVACIVFHNPGARPMEGKWAGPLGIPSKLIFNNLHDIVGIEALKFNGIEAVLALVIIVAGLRRFSGDPVDGPRPPMAPPLLSALRVSFVAIVAWCVFGLARGGDGRQLFWQVRHITWLPVVGMLFARYLTGRQARRFFAVSMVLMASARALEGWYFYNFIAKPRGYFRLEYVITHDDSVLFGLCIIIAIAAFIELPRRPRNIAYLGALGLIVYALIINRRRLAYVSLAISLSAVFMMLSGPVKKYVKRVALMLLPVVGLYMLAAQFSKSSIFAPVHSLTSVTDKDNASNQSRDDENINLVYTIMDNPVVGSGFGHPYKEVIRSFDISKALSNYRYLAHNSVLWLWTLMGLVGVSLAWAYLGIMVLLARRIYERATEGEDRVAALASIAMVIMYMVQAYGDMGIYSWMILMLQCAAVATVGSLSVEVGAWPAPRTEYA
jgi:hypothetical protein